MQRRALANHGSGASYLRRWFVQKYRLPASHPLFTGQTEADLYLEMFEDLCEQRDRLRADLEEAERQSGRGSDRAAALTRIQGAINRINGALGQPSEAYDPVADEWDRQIDAGGMPDFGVGARRG